jgi:hypothetical protein
MKSFKEWRENKENIQSHTKKYHSKWASKATPKEIALADAAYEICRKVLDDKKMMSQYGAEPATAVYEMKPSEIIKTFKTLAQVKKYVFKGMEQFDKDVDSLLRAEKTWKK